jgi:small subunit ribosomal protein S7
MPRRNRPPKREIAPDIKYNSVLVTRFVNKLMYSGKKSTAQHIFYEALDIAEQRAKRPGLALFEQAVRNATPIIEARRVVGGATYQVPVRSRLSARVPAIRWPIIAPARNRPGKTMAEKRQRVFGRGEQYRPDDQEARRHPQDGGGEPGIRTLSLVIGE